MYEQLKGDDSKSQDSITISAFTTHQHVQQQWQEKDLNQQFVSETQPLASSNLCLKKEKRSAPTYLRQRRIPYTE